LVNRSAEEGVAAVERETPSPLRRYSAVGTTLGGPKLVVLVDRSDVRTRRHTSAAGAGIRCRTGAQRAIGIDPSRIWLAASHGYGTNVGQRRFDRRPWVVVDIGSAQ
jgi:hypothetical protein